jgi:hypothetical protein
MKIVTRLNTLTHTHTHTHTHRPIPRAAQVDAFLRGFWDLVPRDLVAIFTDHELELLICGLPEIDVEDLKVGWCGWAGGIFFIFF